MWRSGECDVIGGRRVCALDRISRERTAPSPQTESRRMLEATEPGEPRASRKQTELFSSSDLRARRPPSSRMRNIHTPWQSAIGGEAFLLKLWQVVVRRDVGMGEFGGLGGMEGIFGSFRLEIRVGKPPSGNRRHGCVTCPSGPWKRRNRRRRRRHRAGLARPLGGTGRRKPGDP